MAHKLRLHIREHIPYFVSIRTVEFHCLLHLIHYLFTTSKNIIWRYEFVHIFNESRIKFVEAIIIFVYHPSMDLRDSPLWSFRNCKTRFEDKHFLCYFYDFFSIAFIVYIDPPPTKSLHNHVSRLLCGVPCFFLSAFVSSSKERWSWRPQV